MPFRIAIAVALGLAWHAASARAQEPLNDEMQTEVASMKARIDTFFEQLTGGSNGTPDAERAVREIIGSGPLKDRTMEIEKLIDQAQTGLEQRYGAYTGHELASVRNVGEDLVFVRYLYKAERYPIVWYFTFYRTTMAGGFKSDWSLIGLRFDSKIEVLDR